MKLLVLALILLAGCSEAGRYQLITANGNIIRLDTKTGETALCYVDENPKKTTMFGNPIIGMICD